ncbi:acetate/propionate family kinase [Sneathiella sp. P13V-1]|uniref:acetate/propionate family kinase n=1 Tax=Sneathiella sp. P13V-1 TaxID=2697366 RepID=UPI00187B4851|nr:acetate/propionate family kinase [Sneathiella sp. P13V-1]MBE7637531.1 acetate/propionate family kinase [Sneathiella sp. P13V-1]
MSHFLTINAGSSSLKFAIYEAEEKDQPLYNGQVEAIGLTPKLIVNRNDEKTIKKVEAQTAAEALMAIFTFIKDELPDLQISAIGHRIVHGGIEFEKPVKINAEVIDKLEELSPLAPLHQPHNLAAVRASIAEFPEAVQVGCFDTSFHRGHPWVNDTFALPRRFYEAGVRRYGFHGLSYEYLSAEVVRRQPELEKGRLVIAHLGSGASLCAIRQGQSIGSTMGFSALDGLPMGTRSGQIDPGVLLYLMEHEAMTASEISNLLYKESGLKGLSGISSDMRALEQSNDVHAKEAIDYYVFRIQREIGAMSAVLQGIDAIIFSGGVGENSSYIRSRVMEKLDYLGFQLDEEKNKAGKYDLSGAGDNKIYLLPTNEERVILEAVRDQLS